MTLGLGPDTPIGRYLGERADGKPEQQAEGRPAEPAEAASERPAGAAPERPAGGAPEEPAQAQVDKPYWENQLWPWEPQDLQPAPRPEEEPGEAREEEQPAQAHQEEPAQEEQSAKAHVEVPEATYFVTFGCRRPIELSPEARDLMMATIKSCDGESLDLVAAVVMPDHAHAIFRLIEPGTLTEILKGIKGRTAHRINQMLKHNGAVWTE